MKNKKHLIPFSTVFIILFSLAKFSYGQEFTAEVSSNSVSVGEQIQVTFTLNTAGASGFRAPSFKDFNVLLGPNQGQQTQIINGVVSQSITFTYLIQAIKEGTFKIGSAEITVGKNKLMTNPISISVSGNQNQGGQAQNKSSDNSGSVAGGKNVFIRAHIDKSNVYIGEGIAVTYKMYTKVTLLNYSVNKLPSFTGFWSQEISMPQQLDFHNENIDGVNYKVADIKKVIIFPQRSGSLSIDPMEGEVIARVQVKRQQQQSNDPWSQFFNDPFGNMFNNIQDIKVALKSEPLKVNVRELPSGAPQSFSGAVGKFSCEISIDRKELNAHDAATLKVKISGKGNIKLVEAPHIEFPPDFETYDPKENVSVNATLNGVTGSKAFEYLVIPRNPGNYRIDVAPFSFFDIEKKQYATIGGSQVNVHVNRGTESGTTVITGVNKSDVQILGKDIHFIKTREPKFVSNSGPLLDSPWFYSIVTAPALLFAALLVVKRRKESLAGNMKLVRSQRANKVAMKRLSAAKKFLVAHEKDSFLDEMFRALWGFLSDKLQIPVSDLSRETASHELASRNVPDTLIQQLTETLDNCEFARFSGNASESNETLYNKGIDVITKLENIL